MPLNPLSKRDRAGLARSLRYARDLWRAGRKYHLSPPTALRRFYRLVVREQFSPKEVFGFGLLDSGDRLAALSRPVSKTALLAVQRALNPRDRFRLTEHKFDFEDVCRQAGLPAPPLLAVFSKTGRAVGGVPALATADAVRDFLARPAIPNLVVKPATGVHGAGVLVLSKQPDGRWNDGARALTADDLVRHMTASAYDDWLLQERLCGAAELRALSGTDLVQTARVVTLAAADGPPEVLLAWLRITAGPARSDNFVGGTAGHLAAPVDVRSGALGTAVRRCADGFGLEAVTAHPRTGADLVGFRVPRWPEVVALAERAAGAFRALPTVGWDVAVTDRGPVLIEGNCTWGLLPANPDLPAALGKLRAALGG